VALTMGDVLAALAQTPAVALAMVVWWELRGARAELARSLGDHSRSLEHIAGHLGRLEERTRKAD